MIRLRKCLGTIVLAALLSAQAWAHHPVQAKFDPTDTRTVTGVVTGVDWANPHAHVFINVEGEIPGKTSNWAVELASPIELEWNGWREESVAPGTRITVQGPLARNGTRQIWGEAISTDGRRLYTVEEGTFESALGLDARTPGATPRWPDGQPRISGYWAVPNRSSLVEDGMEISMDAFGLLENLDDAPRVAPFQPWARDLYLLRQRDSLASDPMFQYCMPPGGPRQFQSPYGIQFAEQRERQRIFVLMAAGNHNWRLIYTDGRDQKGDIDGDDNNPLFYGRAVAHWEGDTLVVDTKGFNETFWFSNGGLPHTSKLHLIERISRLDANTLQYAVTVDDPGAYTRPWTSTAILQWVPTMELPEYFCQDNRP
ncbi:MAG TPA: DUF6152 family protein [Hyphomicrobiales bacterium]|nr:DUF6152 family protein [Hyphomicrobiales bacterium]